MEDVVGLVPGFFGFARFGGFYYFAERLMSVLMTTPRRRSRHGVAAGGVSRMARTRTVLESLATGVGGLAAVALGLSAGAMLSEGAVLVPWWRSMPPDSFLRWYADNASRLFDFFAPLEIASAVLAVVAGALSGYQRRPGRGWFLASAVLALAVLGAFPMYFQQVNGDFAAGAIALDRVGGELARWATWHWSRTAMGIVAFATAILGVRAAGEKGGP